MSEKSMSSSRSESIRFQSVLERFFVFFPLFMICRSQRDDADGIVRRLSERHKGAPPLNHPYSDPSLLAIILTHVGTDQENAAKHLFRVGEVEAMFTDVGTVLELGPFKYHRNAKCSYT